VVSFTKGWISSQNVSCGLCVQIFHQLSRRLRPVANLLVPDLAAGNFPATGQVAPASAAALVYWGNNGGNTNGSGQGTIFTTLTVPGFSLANVSRPSGLGGGEDWAASATTTGQDLDISELVNVGGQSSALSPDGGMISLVAVVDNNSLADLMAQSTAAQDSVFAGLGEQARGRNDTTWNQGQPASMVLSNAGIQERVSPLGVDNLFSSWGKGDELYW